MKKTRKHLTVMAIIAIITLSFIVLSCDDEDNNDNNDTTTQEETPSVPSPKTITQANGLAFDGTVTIRTSDLYLNADWNAVVANVITAFNAAYTNGNGAAKTRFGNVFANDANAQIVLVNNLANNWEVRDNEFSTLYLKTDSISTASYADAVRQMATSVPEVGKATPAKHSVFLG